jgi:hypothetical protein
MHTFRLPSPVRSLSRCHRWHRPPTSQERDEVRLGNPPARAAATWRNVTRWQVTGPDERVDLVGLLEPQAALNLGRGEKRLRHESNPQSRLLGGVVCFRSWGRNGNALAADELLGE